MQIPMSFEDHDRIPRHPDWRWEYWDGAAHLSYRPRAIGLSRDAHAPVRGPRRHDVRLVEPDRDHQRLRAFLSEFWRGEDPVRTFDDAVAAEWLRSGLDSSFARRADVAGALAERDGTIIGAVLLERPPRDDVFPELSWLAVRSGCRCDGVGTDLLAVIVDALCASGVASLRSSVSPGNRASISWHWRNGFAVLPDPLAR